MNRGEAMDRSVFFGLYPELFPYEEKIVLLAEDPDQDPRNFSSGLKTPGQKLRTKTDEPAGRNDKFQTHIAVAFRHIGQLRLAFA